MPSTDKNILIVNFDFPPNQGIGGRRWGKLAKGLAIAGYNVFVIKADPVRNNSNSPWTDDVMHPNIHVYSIPRTYPEAFSHPENSFFGKLKYRFNKFKLLRKERGTIFDISIGWDKYFEPLAKKIISENNITNIVATGAPWNLMYFVCQLKQHFTDLNIISDFRDPWINAKNYGMQGLSSERKIHEEFKHQFVLSNSDVVITPAKDMTDELISADKKNSKAKFEVLGHFYDEDDVGDVSSTSKSDEIVLVYGGDLYIGVEPQLQKFADDLAAIKLNDPNLYSKLKVKIFTNSTVPSFLKSVEVISTFPSIGKQIFKELRSAHYCLIFLPDNKKNHITTKSIEYLPFRKPFLVYAPAGDFTRFVGEHKLGFHMMSADVDVMNVIEKNTGLKIESTIIEERTLKNATAKLISLLK